MAKKNIVPPKSFEDAQSELEAILADIERGEVGLEESLAKYERGVFLIGYCRTVLNSAEQQIELLSKEQDGTIKATPMPSADGAAAAQE